MIKSLHIDNYALIDELNIDFAPGFNIITGETGAGKSIILGALTLLLGGRADLKAIRRDERKSVIEAVFSTVCGDGLSDILKDNDLDDNGEDIILRRELAPGGRSRAFVNDTPVSLQLMRQIGTHLVDIHSQHQNQLLASAQYQLGIIDSLADNDKLLTDYRRAFSEFRHALRQYTETRDLLRRNRDEAEFIQYQYDELSAMKLLPGEHQSLEKERELLANVSEVKEKLTETLTPLTGTNINALSLIHQATDALARLSDTLGNDDDTFHTLANRLESARIEIADIAETLTDRESSINADPERLAEVEERLSQIYSLETKHHVDNSDGLIALRDRLEKQLQAIDNGDDTLQRLETMAKRAKRTAMTLATGLSERRAKAATEFAAQLREQAAPLGMPNLRCDIAFTHGKLGPDGTDQVQFLFAFNKNQTLLPVGGTASGGEISRLMLAIKSIVAKRMHMPAIIFDEIDTGVSGDIAGRMGNMMAGISQFIQVITITHLPGVAAMGRRHFKVYKEDDELSTNTRIRTLDQQAREAEIALMISGSTTDEAALANARALLAKADRDTPPEPDDNKHE